MREGDLLTECLDAARPSVNFWIDRFLVRLKSSLGETSTKGRPYIS